MAKPVHSMVRVFDEAKSLDFYARAFGLEVADYLKFADFALIYDPNFKTSPYKLIPGVALQANEADATVNGKSLATFATLPGAYAIGQAPINELLFAPHSEEQLAEFLQITGGGTCPRPGRGQPTSARAEKHDHG